MPESVKQATDALAAKLSGRRDIIRSVRQPGGGPFFEQNGLLYLSTEEVERTTNQLTLERPLLRNLGSDPSLRGMVDGLAYGTSAPNPIRPRLRARSSVSSKPACANGPTRAYENSRQRKEQLPTWLHSIQLAQATRRHR
jgi:hypothetical protein